MIETRAAQAALDEILAVEGIDGVFVGPSDFSIALSNGAQIDPGNAEMLAAARQDGGARRSGPGKSPARCATNGAGGAARPRPGLPLIALGSDFGYLTAGRERHSSRPARKPTG